MLFFDILEILQTNEKIIAFLRGRGLLLSTAYCENCSCDMREQRYSRGRDEFIFRCINCCQTRTIRYRSIFQDARLTFRQIVAIVYLTSLDVLQGDICETLGVSKPTLIYWQDKIRNAISEQQISIDPQLGGEGHIVEIDESMISRAKRTRNRHARAVSEKWVFGLFDRTTKVGHLELVDDRSASTLIPIILRICRPGTIIYSDGWPAYSGIQALGFEHRVVIHENFFVDPITGVHTNNIENYWKRCKSKFKRMSGAISSMIPSYLDEFTWLDRYGKRITDRFDETLKLWRIDQ